MPTLAVVMAFVRGVRSACQVTRQMWLCPAHRTMWTSPAFQAGEKWRLRQGLGKCGNEYGPLVDIPDWSYADGRPAPLGEREIKRRTKRKETAHRVMELMEEMHGAKTRYAKKQQDVQRRKEEVMTRKLKPKVQS